MLNQLRADADLETSERAEAALVTVLESLVRRLTPDEAKDLIAAPVAAALKVARPAARP